MSIPDLRAQVESLTKELSLTRGELSSALRTQARDKTDIEDLCFIIRSALVLMRHSVDRCTYCGGTGQDDDFESFTGHPCRECGKMREEIKHLDTLLSIRRSDTKHESAAVCPNCGQASKLPSPCQECIPVKELGPTIHWLQTFFIRDEKDDFTSEFDEEASQQLKRLENLQKLYGPQTTSNK